MDRFKETLEECGLHDLGFTGDPFTWRNNNHDARRYIRERLDRAVATQEWCNKFISYRVEHGDPGHSDHRPIIVHINEDVPVQRSGTSGDAGFRFEASWMEEDMCATVIENAWQRGSAVNGNRVADIMKEVAGDLKHWSRTSLGDLEKRISKLKKEVERCRRKAVTQEEINKEHLLRYKLDRLEEQKNIYWKQRAHVDWMALGDRNTTYFHTYASARKKRNRIKN
jgi:hypothetical protein